MRRLAVFLTGLLLLFQTGTGEPQQGLAATGDKVGISIHLVAEGDPVIPGTETIVFDVYDLTDWRGENGHSEKEAKQLLLDTYATKEAMRQFVLDEQLEQVNSAPIPVTNQAAELTLSRYRKNKDAAYLILASGETGNQHFLPIVLFFPQIDPKTNEESWQLQIYGKYVKLTDPATDPDPEPPRVPTTVPPTSKVTSQKDFPATSKQYPQTNELRQCYLVLGGLLSLFGAIGLLKNKKIRGKKE